MACNVHMYKMCVYVLFDLCVHGADSYISGLALTIFASLSASRIQLSCHRELMHKYILIPARAQDEDPWYYPRVPALVSEL